VVDDTNTWDPLAEYDELVMAGEAPDPETFAGRYPDHPDLLDRIRRLEALREDLDAAARHMSDPAREWPSRVAGYRLVEPLGQGGMAAVFRARKGGIDSALKLLKQESRIALQRFEREARVTAALEHPAIARVIGWGSAGGLAYLATELVEGHSLRASIEATVAGDDTAPHLPESLVARVRLIAEVADALGVAHEQRIIHRDVKPSNIMVQPDGRPKLIDFGIAVEIHPDSDRITRTGVFVGSHNFAAPEQLIGQKKQIGPWTDTYALGTTLFEVLALRTPFAFPTLVGRATRAFDKPPHGPRHFEPHVPRALDRLVMQALAPKPKKRFADGHVMARALRQWLARVE
jgi:serine/threonine-protein kinase